MLRRIAVKLGLAASILLLLAAGEGAPDSGTNPALVAAERKYQIAVQKAKKEFDRQLIGADRQRIADLKAALASAMNAKNLRDAERLDAARSDAEKELASHLAEDGPPPALAGTWHVSYFEGAGRDYEFLPDGTVKFIQERRVGRLTGNVVDFGDGQVERWSPAGRLSIVEHFNPARQLATGHATTLGVAVRTQ